MGRTGSDADGRRKAFLVEEERDVDKCPFAFVIISSITMFARNGAL